MKRNLHSVCLVFLFFFFFIVGLAGLVNADGDQVLNNDTYPYNYTANEINYSNTTQAIQNIDVSDYFFNYTTSENNTSENTTNENNTSENTTNENNTSENTTNENNTSENTTNNPEYELLIYGYTDKPYKFGVQSTISVTSNISQDNFLNDTNVIALWDAKGNKLNCNITSLSNTTYSRDPKKNCITYSYVFSHKWNESGKYVIVIGTLPKDEILTSSFSLSILIIEHAMVPSLNMSEEKKEFDGTSINNFYNYNNSTNYYCAYENNKYDFSATLNRNNTHSEDTEGPMIIFGWGDNHSDYIPYDKNKSAITDNVTFVFYNSSHEWHEIGSKNISVGVAQLDSFNQKFERETAFLNDKSRILIIKDPKNFIDPENFLIDPKNFLRSDSNVSTDPNNSTFLKIPPSKGIASIMNIINPFIIFIINPFIRFIIERFSNLQNVGITIATAGLIVLVLIYTKNVVPVKISLFGLKPLDLKSVDSFIGIATLVTGLYLYFIFGRCPWDIPIVSDSKSLSNIYFCMLYYEYAIPRNGLHIPYMSILLGLVVVFSLSVFIYGIGIPFLKGESKSGKFFREILRGERFFLPRSSTQQFSVQLKGLFILLKEKVRRISLTDQIGDRFPGKSGKKEEILRSPKT
jgi:hypothetical protein